MTKFLKNSAILAVAALVSMGGIATASAQSGPVLSTEVEYKDLDLSTAKGQKLLKSRYNRAIGQVCPRNMIVDSRTRDIHDRCRQVAAKSAETQIAALVEKQQLALR